MNTTEHHKQYAARQHHMNLDQLESKISKREYFAAMAMQGIIANADCSGDPFTIAVDAVQCADRLLEALQHG